jgi:hypothetical protein
MLFFAKKQHEFSMILLIQEQNAMFDAIENQRGIEMAFEHFRRDIQARLDLICLQVRQQQEFDYFCFSLYSICYLRHCHYHYDLYQILLYLCRQYGFDHTLAAIRLRIDHYQPAILGCLNCNTGQDHALNLSRILCDYIGSLQSPPNRGLLSKQMLALVHDCQRCIETTDVRMTSSCWIAQEDADNSI